MKIDRCICVLLVGRGLAGCAPGETLETGPPEGWQAQGTRWWQAQVDTAGAFRDLETLDAMGVGGAEITYLASPQVELRGAGLQRQFEQRVKLSLISLYRNQPELVDSLFERYVAPRIQDAASYEDLAAQVDRFKREGYKLLRSHFQEPQMALQLGKDIPVPYPDSLHKYEGTVRTQVYLNQEGEPQAVELLEGIHPVLDGIAMHATTQMRWRPAYRIRSGRWLPIPAWTRFTERFRSS